MAFDIEYTTSAVEHIRLYRKCDQRIILDAVDEQLIFEPTAETRNRKRLGANDLSTWELRIGKYRVFYDVLLEAKVVRIKAVGHKTGNRLHIGGKEFAL